MSDPLYSLSGFVVGVLVGMTGVGGGSLMTPLLILFFGIHPVTAVGTDLLYAAVTKATGSVAHGLARNIEWDIVRRLALGSVPSTITTLILLYLVKQTQSVQAFITIVLCVALLLTAGLLVFRDKILQNCQHRFAALGDRRRAVITGVLGAVVGILVTLSSVGAGAIGVCILVILYPKLPMARIVGADIAHAVPLTVLAGLGHWVLGTVDWHIVGLLLAGSLPGVILGSFAAVRVPGPVLRLFLAATLVLVSSKLLYDQLGHGSILVTAFTRRPAH